MGEVLAANGRDVEAAASTLDEGGLDRLRLDEQRVATLARQLADDRCARAARARDLQQDARKRAERAGSCASPSATIGANFEARPGVALDIAAQVLKSLNTIVLRTGGAALVTARTLVDQVLRPALGWPKARCSGGWPRALELIGREPRRSSPSPRCDPTCDPARQRRFHGGSRAASRPTTAFGRCARRGRRRPLRSRLGQSLTPRDGDRRRQPRPARRL